MTMDGSPRGVLPPESLLEAIGNCKYCAGVSAQTTRTPISCTKYAGSLIPISVNLAACHSCGEYKLTDC